MKFEVGKRYNPHYNGIPKRDVVYECVYQSNDNFVLKRPDGGLLLAGYPEYYSEHVEPEKGTRYMAVFQAASGKILASTYGTREKAEHCMKSLMDSSKPLAIVEVEWTEGQGL